VRHHLVQRIVRAYDEHKARVAEQQMLLLAEAKNLEAPSSGETPASDEQSPAEPKETK
jgi:hypothetical protein